MKADLHVHTKCSRCSNNEFSSILKRTRHLDGVAITDHNTMEGSRKVAKLNKSRDFEIIPAEEITTDEGELLGYYLSDDIKPGNVFEVIDEIKSQGGVIGVPHPFDFIRKEAVNRNIKHIMKKIDVIEGVNGRSTWLLNRKALDFAAENSFPAIGGSDAHFESEIGKVYTEFESIKKPQRIYCKRPPLVWGYYLARSKIHKMRKASE